MSGPSPDPRKDFSHSLQSVQVDVAPIDVGEITAPRAERPPPFVVPAHLGDSLSPSSSPTPEGARSPGLTARITSTLSCWQIFYVVVFQGVGSMLLDAGVNFGLGIIAFKPTAALWDLPGSIAGNCFVTALVQCILTWIIASQLQFTDLRKGIVRPVHVVRLKRRRSVRSLMRGTPLPDPPIEELIAHQRPSRRFLRWMLRSDDAIAGPEVQRSKGGGGKVLCRLRIIGRQAARGALWSLPFIVVFWPIAIAVCAGIWGDAGYGSYPIPQGILAGAQGEQGEGWVGCGSVTGQHPV
jgi:hypothetical protein